MRRQRGGEASTVERVRDRGRADERVLQHLAALGVRAGTPCEVRHYLYFPARNTADAAADALGRSGWLVELEWAVEAAWLVVASSRRTLTHALVRDTRRTLETLASEHGGVYDGWEARAP